MLEDKPLDIEIVRKRYDKSPGTFDEYENTFVGRLYHELEWEGLLKSHLPDDRNAKVLDAGGGTGRMTLPLAKIGYQVTLCDLSSGMLGVAKEKLQREGVLDRVKMVEADIASLPFPDETFALVLCLHGAFSIADSFKAAAELTRVMRRGGKIIVDAHSRYWAAIHELSRNPEASLKLAQSRLNRAYDIFGDWCRVFSPEEIRELFESNGIGVIAIGGSFAELLPREIQQAREWNDELLSQVVEVMMRLGRERSVLGLSFILRLVGVKRSEG